MRILKDMQVSRVPWRVAGETGTRGNEERHFLHTNCLQATGIYSGRPRTPHFGMCANRTLHVIPILGHLS